ncbi:hypothetical protein SAMN04490239_1766 [Rhodococcus koreensis]|uniref:Uncharacterized protein n=1 Tax=Rhodococcus koreensis TaxID=99653 RepID=A0A1H4ME70_9NOCA|nr:hypothetical protein SAMN04490239_1766 [Rhodococcus koreensis]
MSPPIAMSAKNTPRVPAVWCDGQIFRDRSVEHGEHRRCEAVAERDYKDCQGRGSDGWQDEKKGTTDQHTDGGEHDPNPATRHSSSYQTVADRRRQQHEDQPRDAGESEHGSSLQTTVTEADLEVGRQPSEDDGRHGVHTHHQEYAGDEGTGGEDPNPRDSRLSSRRSNHRPGTTPPLFLAVAGPPHHPWTASTGSERAPDRRTPPPYGATPRSWGAPFFSEPVSPTINAPARSPRQSTT